MKIRTVIRIISGLIFAFGVYTETGIVTFIFCLLMLPYAEISNWQVLEIIKILREQSND
jgi:phage shock protein PspC (stress-responsive transcriptional regulator)